MSLAERLIRQFKPQAGADPAVFLTAIVTIMVRYPVAVVEEVVDPFFGLPAKLPFPPTPYDVKQACEAIMAHRHRVARQGPPLTTRPRLAAPRQGDPAPDPKTGRHPVGTILTDYDAAVALYGRPLERGAPAQPRDKPPRPIPEWPPLP